MTEIVSQKAPLTYLFQATFKDGSVIQQTQEDVSPTVGGKNCFYDVLQRMADLDQFVLWEQSEEGGFAGVSLIDGSFAINGRPFRQLFDVTGTEPHLKDFELVFYKRTLQNIMSAESKAWETPSSFVLGWKAKARFRLDHPLGASEQWTEVERVIEVY